jgi:hypothetical protein
MTVIQLPGRITSDKQLLVELPANIPSGQVTVTIESADEIWTDTEIQAWMQRKPARDGEEAVTLLGSIDTSEWMDIEDPVAWVSAVRENIWTTK